jgi:hypothetical protein
MLERIEHILVSILIAGFGVWMVFNGLHIGRPGAFQAVDWEGTVAGTFVFLVGTYTFIRTTMTPGEEGLPVYRWAEYLIMVSVLGLIGLFSVVLGAGERNWDPITTGIFVLASTLWAAIRKFPGRGAQP